jgi:glycosyltransferase involved in cell wall biosynthesis
MKLSIIIPCFNEIKTIKQILFNVNKSYTNEKEIIIVDDGSIDGTKEFLKTIESTEDIKIFFNEKNFGKGAALNKGFREASGEIILIQDADLEYNPEDYNNLLLPFKEVNADIVYGTRFKGGRYNRILYFKNYVANYILTFFCNMLTNLNLSDMETGYKVFKREVIKSIQIQEKSFSVEPEITIKLAKKKYKFFEVPISYNGRTHEEGKKIRAKDFFYAIFCIIKYSMRREEN